VISPVTSRCISLIRPSPWMTAVAASASWAIRAAIASRQRLLDVGAHPEDVVLDLAHLLVERLACRTTGPGRGRRPWRIGENRADLALDLVVRRAARPGHVRAFLAQPNRPDT
jgi:hypothetical protein